MRRIALTHSALVCALVAAPLRAQNGDRPGEEQPPLPADLVVPPAPARSPAEELATFDVAPGLAVELVAAEPLVHDPVAITFDLDGRLWVVEMRSLMPNVDGKGELEPLGSIAVLTDTDGDGRMDERTVFMDELVLPRAVAPTRDGALVIAPPELLFCRDTDGDGKADSVEVVDRIGRTGLDNPEHAINGLMPTLDNWFRCANHERRYRWDGRQWRIEPNAWGGQWGITKDDVGRVFFNTNSDPLRADLVPSRYGPRNPNHGGISGVNTGVGADRRTWPSRITPGVNRGYRPETLRDDWTLATFTAACSPHVYRGDLLPDEYRGNAIVCEPSGNLLKRYLLNEDERGRVEAELAWEGRELFTSTDERFRPVALADGPDGALYVVDLYRGILQHKVFMTSWLRKQVLDRGLDQHIGLGRIWRVVPAQAKRPAAPNLAEASWTELSKLLGHENGWLRDGAQRIFVEEGRDSRDAYELAREAATNPESALARMHGLWALEGIGRVDPAVLAQALADEDPRVVRSALQVAEPWLAAADDDVIELVVRVAERPPLTWLALLALGAGQNDATDAASATILARDATTAELRSAVLSGLYGRELEFAERLLADERWSDEQPGRAKFLELLARALVRDARADRTARLLELVAGLDEGDWRRPALAAGVIAGRPTGPTGEPGRIALESEPPELARLADLSEVLVWPGRPGVPPELVPEPLEGVDLERFERGRVLYAGACALCHQDSGRGGAGQAPPLRGSPWVLGDPERAAKIVLGGLRGPIDVGGRTWDLEMPSWNASDEDVAAVLTYVRREWTNGAAPVSPETVAAARRAVVEHDGPWTVEALEAD